MNPVPHGVPARGLRLARSAHAASRWRRVLALALLWAWPMGAQATENTLANASIRADFGPSGLSALADVREKRTYTFTNDDFSVTIDGRSYAGSALGTPKRSGDSSRVSYTWNADADVIRVTYELRPGWGFLSKQLTITTSRKPTYRVQEISLFRSLLGEAPAESYTPRSARPALQTGVYGGAMRFADGHGLLAVVQNPFLTFAVDAKGFNVTYSPDMEWRSSYGPFVSDRGLLAPYRLTRHRLPQAMRAEWSMARADTVPGMDEAEVSAFTGMVDAFLLVRPRTPTNVMVGWCVNDYQIDVGTESGRAEYRRIFDRAAQLGAKYVLFAPSNSDVSRREESVDDWSWEHVLWLGLGQKIRRNEWNPVSSPMPSSIQTMLRAARAKHLALLAYVYPVLPFAQNPEWIVRSRDDSTRHYANLGVRSLQDWLIDELVAFHRRTGIGGYSFDHTFLTFDGTSRYAQWFGWRRVMEELRRRIPDVVVDGRQAYHLYGPWSWLAGTYPHPTFNDEQPESFVPFPDLHFDRVSADRERYTAYRYRNYEFAPSEIVPGFITHQTSRGDDTGEMPQRKTDRGVVLTSLRARDWDYLGWRYSLLSSIAVAGFNNVLNVIPARDSSENGAFAERDARWFRGWLHWTASHAEYVRHARTILGEPGLGKVDGTSMIVGRRGFAFLFNPNARRLASHLPLDASIGLTGVGRYRVREKYPLEGRLLGRAAAGGGNWTAGDTVPITLDGGSALVLEIEPEAAALSGPVLFNAPGRAVLSGDTLELTGVQGEQGTSATLLVQLPQAESVKRVMVNGTSLGFTMTGVTLIAIPVHFAGSEFRQMQQVGIHDSTFTGGTWSATTTVPQRIFAQLAARRAAWPIPWTPEDYRTTWLAPERLILYVQVAEPNDSMDVRLTIDGRETPLEKAYASVRVHRPSFVGFYADVSQLPPDREHTISLALPKMKPGQFLGVFFENVEPAYTTVVH